MKYSTHFMDCHVFSARSNKYSTNVVDIGFVRDVPGLARRDTLSLRHLVSEETENRTLFIEEHLVQRPPPNLRERVALMRVNFDDQARRFHVGGFGVFRPVKYMQNRANNVG